ncbi:MAG TPA: biotin synthase BioB [Candidatus Kapabacteria bacterium]|nr:biotin synthase BioB [Candidatus Kapabacteria bacterium]
MQHHSVRTDWSVAEITELYHTPLLALVARASSVHTGHHSYRDIQCCTLLSVKTGGCPEDCAYCPQAARYATGVDVHRLMDVGTVTDAARQARDAGSTRFCMGAAWREVRDNSDFDRVLEMVTKVRALGLEVCCTLGMVTADQARRLAEAGLTAYNHNIDTSSSFYGSVITTRAFDDRIDTIANVRAAGLSVCSGGIIGMGEGDEDRIGFLHTLACFDPHPESVPINVLVPVEGTPLAGSPPVDPFDLVRMVACARILMPRSRVRLSAGRLSLSHEAQALAFLAGANSIFTGEKLLTTPNPGTDSDQDLFHKLGVVPTQPYSVEFTITESAE